MAGRNDFSKNETLMKIAVKHGKSVAQGANQSKNPLAKTARHCHFELSHKAKNLHCHFE